MVGQVLSCRGKQPQVSCIQNHRKPTAFKGTKDLDGYCSAQIKPHLLYPGTQKKAEQSDSIRSPKSSLEKLTFQL